MKKKKKLKVNSRFLYAAASIALAAVIAFVAIPTVTSRTNGKTSVLRVTKSIDRGEQIKTDQVAVEEVGAYNLPAGVALKTEDVAGKYAAADLEPGDFLLPAKVSETPISSDVSLNQIPSGKLAYSVTVKTQAAGLSDKLQKGDVVRVYHYKDQAQLPPELQFVRVLSVSDSGGNDIDYTRPIDEDNDDARPQTATVTLLVSPEQGMILTELENDGVLQFALVSRGSEKLAAELLQKQDQVIEDAKRTAEEKKKAAQKEMGSVSPEPEQSQVKEG